MKTILKNGRIITPYRIIDNGAVIISGNKIVDVIEGDFPDTGFENDNQVDGMGHYISPGFIDMHVHGGGGFSFMDATVEAFVNISKMHARHGTTLMSPTTLSCSHEDLLNIIKCFQQVSALSFKGAAFTGLHLEGPYIAMNQRGAQDERFIRNPDEKEYNEILEYAGLISRWSIAPELPGSLNLGRLLQSKNILAAIAHTDAVHEDVIKAMENGYTLLTHFYSAMHGVTRRNAYRSAGVIESGYLLDELDIEIIADGIHLPPSLLQLIYKQIGVGRTALITDAMRATGLPPGESILGSLKNGFKVIVEDGVAKLPDRSGFAGSVATADRLVRTMVHDAKVPLLEAVRMITTTPARILNLSATKGSISKGKDADITIFDKNINITTTIVAGQTVFERSGSL